jgi:hypothetical protein
LLFLVSYSIVWVLTSDCCNFSQRVRHGKFKNAQKKFEHPPNPVVYYSMNNFAGCIEGHAGDISGWSDLKSRETNGSEPSLVGGVGVPALGMLTITGSNMHRGIEMPVAQPYFLAGAGWYKRHADAHVRGVAVAQRLHSATFGGGATRMKMRKLQRSGG